MDDTHSPSPLQWAVLGRPGPHDIDSVALALRTSAADLVRRTGVRRPALTVEDGTVRLTLRTLDYDDDTDAVETGQLDLLVRGDVVVTAHRPANHGHPRRALVTDTTGAHPVATVCRWVIRSYEEVCAALFVDIEEVEESVFSAVPSADAERIYTLKREVGEVRRAVAPLVTPLEELARHESEPDADLVLALRELGDRLHRLAESVDTLDALLSSAFDAHVARISMQQNEDMRKISAAAALVVVPTLVAGIYGMNFEHMPELGWTYGYPLVLGLMAAVVAALWAMFKKTGWL